MTPLADARRLLAETGAEAVLVGLSGGKDSLATLDLCVQAFARVEAFFLYFVPGLRSEDGPVDRAAARYGVRVHRLPHPDLARMLRCSVLRWHRSTGVARVKLRHAEALLRERTGIDWFAYGHRANESVQRRGIIKACAGCGAKTRRVFPLAHWTRADVLTYLRHARIPTPAGSRANMSGFDLRPRTLAWLRDHYPDDYEKVCHAFPFAPVQLRRLEFAAARQAATLQERAGGAVGDQRGAVQPSADGEGPAREARP